MKFAFPPMKLASLISLPGVLQAAIADDAGRLLDCIGHVEPPTAAILVLAHATLSAAAELGRRSGSGDCIEIIQQHEAGTIYLHGLPQRRVLLVRCQNAAPLPSIRALCQQATAVTQPAFNSTSATHDLSSALHVEPAW